MLRTINRRSFLRYYSMEQATKKPIKYTDTINLPKTKFPNRLSAKKRHEVEQRLLKEVIAVSYSYQEAHNREPTFVLHDGPPYANGDLHMGHAVNKILKDITIRRHVARGQKIYYKLGWDCHGLPIELKALTSQAAGSTMSALDLRKKCRMFALNAMKNQKEDFRSWGILSNWHEKEDNSIYMTLQPNYIVNQLRLFFDLYERGFIYRDLKPVFWSPSSRTALAEAELEYDPNYLSPSVYIRFAVDKFPIDVENITKKSNVYALVWTTTPWTIPSNQAICYNAEMEYSLVKLDQDENTAGNDMYVIASALIKDFESMTQRKCEVLLTIQGTKLANCTYLHPINMNGKPLPFLPAMHVQDTKGTGLVHTAPAHGPDDFLVSLAHKLDVKCFVNELGQYTNEAPEFLRGKHVLTDGDNLVLQHLKNDVVFASTFTHSYPIDWRTKQPLIIRASDQWFVNTERLKERAVEEINSVNVYPKVNADASRKTLITQVLKRPYWCISRQRVWGVPIPVFYRKSTGEVIVNRELLEHVCQLVQTEGNIDFWWSHAIEEIIPIEILDKLHMNANELIKGMDIFDIWFDSSSSWSTALFGDKIADLYLEGYDQFSGWFQSSLLTSLAARNSAPFKSLFVHGFTVDGSGRKMSKSLGNVISPKDITGKYGTDVLRWWVASHGTQNMSITVDDRLVQQAADNVAKIRSILRYLNGSIGTKIEQSKRESNSYLNKYLLSCLVEYEKQTEMHYESYEYNRVVLAIQNFVANQISAIYVHLIKDRMYCGSDAELQGIRYVLTRCYEVLCKSLWPIIPFLVEESWSYYVDNEGFHQHHIQINPNWKNIEAESAINTALDVKRLVNQRATDANTWTLGVTIACSSREQLKNLLLLQPVLDAPVTDSELCEILQVNNVTLTSVSQPQNEETTIQIRPMNIIMCPRCRRFEVAIDADVCVRCKSVLSTK